MILNESYDFSSAPLKDRLAFKRQFGVHRVLLPLGTRLNKLTEYALEGSHGVTPWWNFLDATSVTLTDGSPQRVPGFATAQLRASRLGVSDQDFGRARSAVSQNWNEMTNLLNVALTREVYGFFGKNAGMPLDGREKNPEAVMLIGGSFQLYIPNLTGIHVRAI